MVSLYGQTERAELMSVIRDGDDFSELLNISFAAIHTDSICDNGAGAQGWEKLRRTLTKICLMILRRNSLHCLVESRTNYLGMFSPDYELISPFTLVLWDGYISVSCVVQYLPCI